MLRTRCAAVILTVAALAGAGTLAACGDDEEDSGEQAATETTTESSGPAEITVTADEYTFELSETPTAPGEATFTMDNVGKEPHAMILAKVNEGFTLAEAFELQGRKGSAEVLGDTGAPPGQESKPVEAKLTAGDYGLVCPLRTKDGESHFELGQSSEFTIG